MAADALITDYSSIEMDFMLTHRPQFQLIQDLECNERGFYILPQELPFPLATDEDGLADAIEHFDEERYQQELDAFMKNRVGVREQGTASKSIVEWILSRKDV